MSSKNHLALASRLPSLERLQSVLDETLREGEAQVRILHRERNLYTSTSPSEIVTVLLGDGAQVQLFNKYFFDDIITAGSRSSSPFNEVRMYRHVLRPPLTLPRVFGTWIDEAAGEAWLMLEYLASARRLIHVVDPATALVTAARWMGEFHRSTEDRLDEPELAFLHPLGGEYYRACLRRLIAAAGEAIAGRLSWLLRLEEQFDDASASLARSRRTVIHGEFYPKNVLMMDGAIYPIDWETAAIGFGEVDFAMLMTGWPAATFDRCLRAYAGARGLPEEEPDLRERITAGHLLVDLHWLAHAAGNTQGTTAQLAPDDLWLEHLRQSAVALGIV